MAAMNANGVQPDGTPLMGNMPHPNKRNNTDPREQLNTYIYDYFMRNEHFQLARAMLDANLKMSTDSRQKTSPKNRANGIDPMDDGRDDLPTPLLPQNQMADNSFLLDWWVQFWDIYQATKNRGNPPSKGAQYIQHTRNLAQMQNDQRNQRMMMNNPMNAQYQNMMRNGMANGAPNDLKRAALNNRPSNGNPMNMGGQMKNPAMMAAQMQRDGSNMGDMNGQRPQSPGPNNDAPSPNKRPRMEGGMNNGVQGQFGEFAQPGQNAQQKNIEVYAQSLAQQHRVALNNNTASPQGMNSGIQGSPLAQAGLDGQHDMFAGNQPRPGINQPAAQGAPQQGNHALQDYQMQLMLLEQQNKKRLLMARQEQDNMSGPGHQQGVGQGFPAAMSPQGNRPGLSPNPADQMKRGTPKLGQMPGSPLPDQGMQQRGSPAPNMQFDPALAPPGMPPQFYPQMQHQSPMIRPPSSHPGANFPNGQQLTPQQMEAMRNGQMQPNGQWRGPQQPGMMPGQQQMNGPMGGNPQQRQMPPPPAPANDQPRPEPSPSQSNQAPPTPSQSNKPGPKKKGTKDNPQQVQQQPVQQTPAMDQPPFGNLDGTDSSFDLAGFDLNDNAALENFDFDSFLQNPNDDAFNMGTDFDFNHVTEVGNDL
ncbi:hypothetical protein EK21DRAFT_59444 [Setomelanomma holmii]|uniref:LisH domain-containing protein n=1 Tax=Setomelanomma holmii TaxID=210430 RepID=A0A9P4HEL4_9PLEO|nr:hypothetical protein EK21DRAFT_59444 [Setomelanomma holmii]